MAKSRVYTLKSRSEKQQNVCSMEKVYGKMRPQSTGFTKWNWWQDKMFYNYHDLVKFEQKYDLKVDYEEMPKFEQVVKILESFECKQKEEAPKDDIKRIK